MDKCNTPLFYTEAMEREAMIEETRRDKEQVESIVMSPLHEVVEILADNLREERIRIRQEYKQALTDLRPTLRRMRWFIAGYALLAILALAFGFLIGVASDGSSHQPIPLLTATSIL